MRSSLGTSLLATIPFVLLLNSDHVTVTTEFYGDVSGLRRVEAEGPESRQGQITESMPEMWLRFDHDGSTVSDNRVRVSRSIQVHDLGALDDVEASALDIVQKPLSLATTYTWHERVMVELGSDSERDRRFAEHTDFEYRVTMPGKVETTSAKGQGNGGTATWTLNALDAAEGGCELSATAVAWRWDVILLLVYILGYAAYRIVAEIAHRAQLRPRKI